MKNGLIKHIFFDIGGVLLEIDPRISLQYWSDCTDLSINVLKDHFPYEAHEQYEIGQLSDHGFFKAVKDFLPQPNCFKEEDFWRGWNKLIVKEKETIKLLPLLMQSYGVYLLSNTNPRHINHEVEERFSFQNHVHGAFYSFDLGCRKPEKEIFLKVLDITGANPEESLFIDDVEANVKQAQKLGFKTILYSSYEETKLLLHSMGIIIERAH
ncbi:MAG: HAD family phosphatase [Candidatus Marinimicrobia bacterium]|nr:HAD family phosphatase [Candidatus Neomarinimicrobiota bacterium]